DPHVADSRGVEVLEHAIRNRADMTVRPSGGHNHVVGDRGFATQIDGGGVLSLHVVETGEDEAKRLVGVELHLGDGCGPRTYAGPGDGRCGQGSFLSFRPTPDALPGADTDEDMCVRLTESTILMFRAQLAGPGAGRRPESLPARRQCHFRQI